MEHSFLINDKILLRALEPEDIDLMYQIENDPQVWDISNFTVPYSRFVLKQYIKESQCDIFVDKQLRLIVIRREDNVPIGTIDLSEFSPSHKRAEIGIAINSQYRNMGYASQAIKLLEDYAFKFLHIHSLTALVSVQNDISSRLFISCGYQQTGTLKDWICTEHGYEDVVVFQKLNKE